MKLAKRKVRGTSQAIQDSARRREAGTFPLAVYPAARRLSANPPRYFGPPAYFDSWLASIHRAERAAALQVISPRPLPPGPPDDLGCCWSPTAWTKDPPDLCCFVVLRDARSRLAEAFRHCLNTDPAPSPAWAELEEWRLIG